MDGISFAVAIVSVFNTCLHGYRAVSQTREFGSAAVGYDLRMRIERQRFEIWGRNCGILDPKTGVEKKGYGFRVPSWLR